MRDRSARWLRAVAQWLGASRPKRVGPGRRVRSSAAGSIRAIALAAAAQAAIGVPAQAAIGTSTQAAIGTSTQAAGGVPAQAASGVPALAQANAAYAKIEDYRMTIAVHEVAGDRTEDKIYNVLFKKPALERVDIIAGPDRGGGLVWLGGDTVKAHHGGLFSAIRLTLGLHSRLVATLRGESVDTTTVPAMLGHFATTPGTLAQAPGPRIAGAGTVEITLDVTDPTADAGLTREILYVSAENHFPLRLENYVGAELVKRLDVKNVETNVGLTANDFPW